MRIEIRVSEVIVVDRVNGVFFWGRVSGDGAEKIDLRNI